MLLDANISNDLQPATERATGNTLPCSRIGWIVIHSYPQAERWAQSNLDRRGYTTFLPMMAVQRRDRVIRTSFHTVHVPLFASYLFVRFPGNWTPIRYCPGVYRIISAAGKPNMAADADITALQASEDARRHLPAPGSYWASGTPCSLAIGPLAGMPAVVTAPDDEHVSIAVMFLGALRHVRVHASQLVPRSADA